MNRLSTMHVVLMSIVLAGSFACRTEPVVRETDVVVTESSSAGTTLAVTDVSVFYEPLAPYGEWVFVDPHGWCWTPYGVHIGWRPYTHGHWVWTDYGMTWVSDWPWGWAPFHYGTWRLHDDHGWIWVPGTVWSPAWVCWRRGPRHVGWAPLPPQSHWNPHDGLRGGDPGDPLAWTFVDSDGLTVRDVDTHVLPAWRNHELIQSSRDVTDYAPKGRHAENRSFAAPALERDLGRTLPRASIRDVDSPDAAREGGPDELRAYRPVLSEGRPPHAAPTPHAARQDSDLTRRHEIERQALEDRHRQTRLQVEEDLRTPNPPLANPADAEARRRAAQQRRDLAEQQMTRERKQLDAAQRRDRIPDVRRSDARDPKYVVPSAPTPRAPAGDAPQPRPTKKAPSPALEKSAPIRGDEAKPPRKPRDGE